MSQPGTLSIEEANDLALEHKGWAESIARSVARAWNLDWQLDGLDGAAMEAVLFCARRYDPGRGVPFRGYARKRIHEASTEAARRSKGWGKGLGTKSNSERIAREISAELLNVFPALRFGELPESSEEGISGYDARGAIRQLLVGASMLAMREGIAGSLPDQVMDYKRMIEHMGSLEIVHQVLLWQTYWEGKSMRNLASEWEMDELNVIREHKVLLSHLQKCITKGKSVVPPRVRPGLKEIALKLKKKLKIGPFSDLLKRGKT